VKQKRLIVLLTAILALLIVLAGCSAPASAPAGGEDDAMESASDLVEVTYTYAGSGVPADLPAVQDAMNAIINEKIGVNLILEPIDFGAYNDKMQLRLAAGEECDIIFTAPWINSYTNNVTNGALLVLDELLPEHAPGLWASMPETTWEAARVNGNIYGVINQQIFPKPWGVHVRQDLLDKYEFSLDGVERWEDMEPFLQAVLEGEGITPVFGDDSIEGSNLWRPTYWGIDPLDDGIRIIGVRANDEGLEIINSIESPEFKAAADLTKKWLDAGYFPQEPTSSDEAKAAFRAGLFAMGHHVEKPGNDVESKTAYGFDFDIKNLTNPLILTTAGATATLNGVCATSQHPEEAVQVLNLINTDAELYNLLSRGIEGEHWVWVDEENQVMGYPEGVSADTSPYNPNTDWMFGNQFNAYYRDAAQVGAWEATKEMNDTAFPSVALGYAVDREPIKTEIAQVIAVYEEHVVPILRGWVSYDEAAPAAIEKLKDAGADTIVAEVQRQLEEWKAANSQ